MIGNFKQLYDVEFEYHIHFSQSALVFLLKMIVNNRKIAYFNHMPQFYLLL